MSNAKLVSLTVKNFKSFEGTTRVELEPLTVVVGRNNSGKSTLIQSLLLLKQTLVDVRPDVMLRLDGVVDAFSLRELTFGWPGAANTVEGPTIALDWECEVDVKSALAQPRSPDLENLARHSEVSWLRQPPDRRLLRTRMTLTTEESRGRARVSTIVLLSIDGEHTTQLDIAIGEDGGKCKWNGHISNKIDVEFDHFIPYLRIDRGKLGPRDAQRAWYNAYLVLFEQPLQDLKRLLSEMHYLGSSRQPPPSLFKAGTAAPNELGVSGEFAAQLLHRRQRDVVHFLPPMTLSEAALDLPEQIRARPFVDAVNEVMSALSVRAPLHVEEIQEVGFRLMFGEASLVHVGRGLGSLLPLVELGLFADPLRFGGGPEDMALDQYRERCGAFAHVALEEPEAHLHPKVASRLAHWLVSLALSNRRLIVETHSDHLVRRLRGLVARAGRDSALEQWLLANVVVLSVEQDDSGRSTLTSSRLTAEGGVGEVWPADFMDEATDEESAIYYAKLEKSDAAASGRGAVKMIDGAEPEPDEAP